MLSNDSAIGIVIVAGGKGTRMGNALPKQFLNINSKPILFHTLNAFYKAFPKAQIVVTLPSDCLSYMQMVLQHFPDGIDLTIVEGGSTRYHSVQNGVNALKNVQYVMIHDGVRCIINIRDLQSYAELLIEHEAVIPVVPIKDSLRTYENKHSKAVDRNKLCAVQTPQCFHYALIIKALEQPYAEHFTDEATLVENLTQDLYLVEGNYQNIKITTPEDLIIAEAFLKNSDE